MDDRERDLRSIANFANRTAAVCRRIPSSADGLEKDRLAQLSVRWLEGISDLIDKILNLSWEDNYVRQNVAGTGCGTEIAAVYESPLDITIVQAYT